MSEQDTLRCGRCRTEWLDYLPQHVSFDAWLTHVTGLRCPRCSADLHHISILCPPRPGEVERP